MSLSVVHSGRTDANVKIREDDNINADDENKLPQDFRCWIIYPVVALRRALEWS